MYVEISARQVGKSTRIVDFLSKNIDKYKLIAVVSPNFTSANAFNRLLRKTIPRSGFRVLSTSLNSSNLYEIDMYDFVIYDEFDFNPHITPEHIRPNTYWVTTPRTIRSIETWNSASPDVLRSLVKTADTVTQYTKSYSKIKSINPAISTLSSYRQETLGQFILGKNPPNVDTIISQSNP